MALIRALSSAGGGGETAKDKYIVWANTTTNCAIGDYTMGTRINAADGTRFSVYISLAEPKTVSVSSNSGTTIVYKSNGTVTKTGTTTTTVTDCIAAAICSNGNAYLQMDNV